AWRWWTASSTTTQTESSSRPKAHLMVLACNGIGTPRRLLLNSRSKQFPDGLANRSGLVGRNLMFHLYAMVTGIFDEPLEVYTGPTGCITSQEFYETDRGTCAGYCQHARVVEALGLEARPPHPQGYQMEPNDLTLLDDVRRCPKRYRDG
ncbi:MAG TPA: hypothetical protein VL403_00860, partial [Candidatus Kryptonia bacterium]|nr:hypothetical protein [Candidatus Kryptonia bacterium]